MKEMDYDVESAALAGMSFAPDDDLKLADSQSHRTFMMAADNRACNKTSNSDGRPEQALWGRNDGTIWTTTRCMRLLRPIRVQLNALRQKSMMPETNSIEMQKHMEEEAAAKMVDADVGTSALMNQNLRIGSDANDHDFVPTEVIERVLPFRTSRRIVRKFSLRHNRKLPRLTVAHNRLQPTNSERLAQISTCEQLVSQACEVFSYQSADSTFKEFGDEHVETQETIATRASHTARRRTGRTSIEGHDKLFRAFDDMIKATTGRPSKRYQELVSSAGSWAKPDLPNTRQLNLFQSCLRSIPNVIAQRQQALDDDDEEEDERGDRILVDEEVYSQLEDYSIVSNGGGWRPLRLVVRSHALCLLCDAIREGLIPPNTIKAIVDSCLVRNFAEGPREIVRAWGDGLAGGKISSLMPRAAAWDLRKTSKELGLERHVWDWLTDALGSRDTQIDLLNDMLYLWTHCVYSLVAVDVRERESAIRLLEKIISCALGTQFLDLDAMIHNVRLLKHSVGGVDALPSTTNANFSPYRDTMEMPPIISAIITFLTTVTHQRNSFSAYATSALQRICAHIEKILALTNIENLDDSQRTLALMPYMSLNALLSYAELEIHLPEAQKRWFQNLIHEDLSDEVHVCLAKHLIKLAHGIHKYGTAPHSLKHHVQNMTRHLVKLSKESRDPVLFLAKVAVKTAASFAECDPKRANVSFVQDLENDIGMFSSEESDDNDCEQHIGQTHLECGHKKPRAQKSRFRFEDSISEWVQRTPKQHASRHSLCVLRPPTVPLVSDQNEFTRPVRVSLCGTNEGSTQGSLTNSEASLTDADPSLPSGAITFSIICPPHQSSSEIICESDEDTTLIGSGSPTPSTVSHVSSIVAIATKAKFTSASNRMGGAALQVIVPSVSIETRRSVEAYERERARHSPATATTEVRLTSGRKRDLTPCLSPESPGSTYSEGYKRPRLQRYPLLSPSSTISNCDGDWLPAEVSERRQRRVRRPSLRRSARLSISFTRGMLHEKLMKEGDSEDELAL